MTSGTLALNIVKVENLPHEEGSLAGTSVAVKVRIHDHEKKTKHTGKGHETKIEQILSFDLKDVDGSTEVRFDLLGEGKKKKQGMASGKACLSEFMQGHPWTHKVVDLDNGAKVFTESQWEIKNALEKYGGNETAKAAEQVKETAASVVTVNPQRALAVKETHRPWFARAAYYYDASKNVYNYTTSFRLVASLARLGESGASMVLQTVTGKDLKQLDQGVLVPTLESLDDKVDGAISTVIVKLVAGQNYVLQKKNDVVDTTSHVVGSAIETVNKAKDFTTSQIKTVTSTAVGSVVTVKDYTTTQVVNVSSSAYGKVRGATVYVVSHLPYLGSKIRA